MRFGAVLLLAATAFASPQYWCFEPPATFLERISMSSQQQEHDLAHQFHLHLSAGAIAGHFEVYVDKTNSEEVQEAGTALMQGRVIQQIFINRQMVDCSIRDLAVEPKFVVNLPSELVDGENEVFSVFFVDDPESLRPPDEMVSLFRMSVQFDGGLPSSDRTLEFDPHMLAVQQQQTVTTRTHYKSRTLDQFARLVESSGECFLEKQEDCYLVELDPQPDTNLQDVEFQVYFNGTLFHTVRHVRNWMLEVDNIRIPHGRHRALVIAVNRFDETPLFQRQCAFAVPVRSDTRAYQFAQGRHALARSVAFNERARDQEVARRQAKKAVQSRDVFSSTYRPKSLAVCLAGLVGNTQGKSAGGGLDPKVLDETGPNIMRRIVRANQRRGWQVDVFTQSWDWQLSDKIIATFEPVASDFRPLEANGDATGERYLKVGGGRYTAYERVQQLRHDYEQHERDGVPYDMVIMLRYDVWFFRDVKVGDLNPELLYVANWCCANARFHPVVATTVEGGDAKCVELAPSANDEWRAVPDFWFIASPEHMDMVFIGFWSAANAGVFRPYHQTPAGHGIIGARIDSLPIKLGRYLWHHIDFDLIRWVYETKRDEWYPRTWTIGAGTHLYNLKVPSRFSQCSFVGGVCTHFQQPFSHRVLSSPTFMCDSYTFPPLLTGTPPWYISVPDVNDTVPVDPYLPIT